MNMGEFMKFCKDFGINLSKQKCAEVFKKNAKNSIELLVPGFEVCMGKLFEQVHLEEVE